MTLSKHEGNIHISHHPSVTVRKMRGSCRKLPASTKCLICFANLSRVPYNNRTGNMCTGQGDCGGLWLQMPCPRNFHQQLKFIVNNMNVLSTFLKRSFYSTHKNLIKWSFVLLLIRCPMSMANTAHGRWHLPCCWSVPDRGHLAASWTPGKEPRVPGARSPAYNGVPPSARSQ